MWYTPSDAETGGTQHDTNTTYSPTTSFTRSKQVAEGLFSHPFLRDWRPSRATKRRIPAVILNKSLRNFRIGEHVAGTATNETNSYETSHQRRTMTDASDSVTENRRALIDRLPYSPDITLLIDTHKSMLDASAVRVMRSWSSVQR